MYDKKEVKKGRLAIRLLLVNEGKKRNMRSNRRGTWGSWNLPP